MIGNNTQIMTGLSGIYRDSTIALSDAMGKLASGKKAQSAQEDIHAYTQKVKLEIDIKGYEGIRIKLSDAKTISSAAVNSGSSVYKDLLKMKTIADNYISEAAGNNDPVKLAEFRAGFESLKDTVVSALQNSYVDGTLITQSGTALKTVALDPDNHGQLSIEFSVVADESSIDTFNVTTMTDTSGIDTEIGNALTYLSESKSYNAIIDRQMDLLGLIINNKEAVKSLITDIDEAKVTSEVIDRSIRHEAAGAMIAQANIMQGSMLSLYEL
jgi:flagellin-like hook-associated protein FlgL